MRVLAIGAALRGASNDVVSTILSPAARADTAAGLLLDECFNDAPLAQLVESIEAALANCLVAPAESNASVRSVAAKPDLRLIEGALHQVECAYLIALSRPRLQASTIRSTSDRNSRVSAVRRSMDCGYWPDRQDPVLQDIVRRFSVWCGIPAGHAEPLTVIRYAPGGYFRAHFDAPVSPARGYAGPQDGNHLRQTSIIAYLNDDYLGGETAFPEAGLKIRGSRGDAVMFANKNADGHREPASLHGAMPVDEGDKWVLVTWFRSTPFNASEGAPMKEAAR